MMGFMGMWYGWIFIIAIIAAAVYFFANANKNDNSRFTKNSDTPLDILKKRLAVVRLKKKNILNLKMS